MKFELVGFYPTTEKNFAKQDHHLIGTAHIYAVDCQLDIRGIRVTNQGNSIYFNLPHVYAYDGDTGEKVRYPVIRFTNDETQKEIFEFLQKTVRPLAVDNMKVLKALKFEHKRASEALKQKK
jgi:hypothetical protein